MLIVAPLFFDGLVHAQRLFGSRLLYFNFIYYSATTFSVFWLATMLGSVGLLSDIDNNISIMMNSIFDMRILDATLYINVLMILNWREDSAQIKCPNRLDRFIIYTIEIHSLQNMEYS